jgi:serine/threonine protein kinase
MSRGGASGSATIPRAENPAVDYTYGGTVFRTDQLELGVFLVQGGFGDVYKAKLRAGAGPPVDVVVKQFFPDAGIQGGRAFRAKFEKESAIHMHLDCPYIAKLIGITEGECWQVLELVGIYEATKLMCCLNYRRVTLAVQEYDKTAGPPDFISDLRMLLNYRHGDATPYVLSLRNRLQMCTDVALAMLHLTNMGFLHLDLASLNVLVWKDERSHDVRCKLADFSFAINRHSISSSLKKGGTDCSSSRIPVSIPDNRDRWMAPELISSMPSKPSEHSEVYSFGMVVYEILTGQLPYDGLADLAVAQLVQDDEKREKNLKMPLEVDVLPLNAPAAMQEQFQSLVTLMRRCLKSQPADRPTFNDIVKQLQLIHRHQPVRTAAFACASFSFFACIFHS